MLTPEEAMDAMITAGCRVDILLTGPSANEKHPYIAISILGHDDLFIERFTVDKKWDHGAYIECESIEEAMSHWMRLIAEAGHA